MRTRLLPYLLLACFLCIAAAIFRPLVNPARHNARRASCQSNLKQIGLALQQYAQDNNDHLPARNWTAPVAAYAKTDTIFQCPETTVTSSTNDYFFNMRFLNGQLGDIKRPEMLILLGDGQDDAPMTATIPQLPTAWRKNEKSPAWRHLGGANYGFADGHVNYLKVGAVNRDFRTVTP